MEIPSSGYVTPTMESAAAPVAFLGTYQESARAKGRFAFDDAAPAAIKEHGAPQGRVGIR